MEQEEMMNQFSTNNPHLNNNFMQLRLGTEDLIDKFELFLSNKRSYAQQTPEGTWVQSVKYIGKPMGNPEGISAILNIIHTLVNNHSVQGNFDRDHYWDFLSRTRKEITSEIIENIYHWGIDDSKMNTIINRIMALYETFISRLIDNEERKSYTQNFVSREVVTHGPQEKGSLIGGFGK